MSKNYSGEWALNQAAVDKLANERVADIASAYSVRIEQESKS
ncbi:MAG: hypothetical protein ABSH11_12375 [Verrucomicrobiota bacterium]|jgi:hypothetical protein